jgi:AcrR family transcriptional regulator
MLMKESKLDPRVVRTRELLRQSLVDLIPGKGFNNLSIQEITDHARLNRATFYLHYKDKDELLLDVFDEMVIGSIPQPPPPEAQPVPLKDLHPVVIVLTHIAEYADFYRAILGEQGVPFFMTRVQGYIEDLIKRWIQAYVQQEFKQDEQWDIVINYLGAAHLGVITWWLDHGMPYSPEEM